MACGFVVVKDFLVVVVGLAVVFGFEVVCLVVDLVVVVGLVVCLVVRLVVVVALVVALVVVLFSDRLTTLGVAPLAV